MPIKTRRRVLIAILVTIGLLILLLFAAQAWLGTGIGRGLVENRLSAALGRPVRLDGEFEVGVLPVPGASGTDLRLFTRDGRWLVLEAGSFLARLALRPLLKGEVDVVALRLEDAAVDLGRLALEPAAEPKTPGEVFRIPDIRSFELKNISLHFEGMGSQPSISIHSMSIEDFQLDAPALFEARISLVSEGEDLAEVAANGKFTLRAAGVAEVQLARLGVVVPGWALNGLEGRLSVNLDRSVFDIGLQSRQPERAFSVGAIVDWQPLLPGVADGYRLEELDVAVGAQRISGTGCWLAETPPVLHAALSSPSLDLDALAALVESWRVPQGNGQALPDKASKDDDLPFGVAVRLEADRATYGGALAEGIVLRAGAEPKCP